MQRVFPPKGATNVCHGSTKVGPQGIEVSDTEAEQMQAAGWTVAKTKPVNDKPKPPKGKG